MKLPQCIQNQGTIRLALLLAGMVGTTMETWAQTNNVTGANGFADYIINGQNDPSFTLQRGVTYVFRLSSLPTHPFYIKTAPGFGAANAYNDGVDRNGATFGDITFTVPANAPDALVYQCGNHASMLGTLNIVTPPSPPTVRIVHISVGQNVVVTSTGAAGWNAIPEYLCDLALGTWTAVAPFTNSFAGGTNTTSFGRLEAVCGSPNILIRIRNQQN